MTDECGHAAGGAGRGSPWSGVFSLVGTVIALALLRRSSRPAELFVRAAVSLTPLSMVPP